MSISEMREAIIKAYSGDGFLGLINSLSDEKIVAVYKSFIFERGKHG